jgi:hypothetical protein
MRRFVMKNKRFFTGILATALVFGLIGYGCSLDDDDTTDSGPQIVSRWQNVRTDPEDGEITSTLVLFDDGTWIETYHIEEGDGEDDTETGTYSISGGTITVKLQGEPDRTGTISATELVLDEETYNLVE